MGKKRESKASPLIWTPTHESHVDSRVPEYPGTPIQLQWKGHVADAEVHFNLNAGLTECTAPALLC